MVERLCGALGALTEMGLQLAGQVRDEAARPGADLAALVLAFTRAAKAVRQSVALEAALAEVLRRRQSPTDLREAPDRRVAERQFETEMFVEKVIERDAPDSERERLTGDLYERLTDSADLFASDASLADIITGICQALGLAPDFAEFTDHDWGGLDIAVRHELRRMTGKLPEPALPGHRTRDGP